MKYQECNKIVKQKAFERAIAGDEHKRSVVDSLDIESMSESGLGALPHPALNTPHPCLGLLHSPRAYTPVPSPMSVAPLSTLLGAPQFHAAEVCQGLRSLVQAR